MHGRLNDRRGRRLYALHQESIGGIASDKRGRDNLEIAPVPSSLSRVGAANPEPAARATGGEKQLGVQARGQMRHDPSDSTACSAHKTPCRAGDAPRHLAQCAQ